MDVYLKVIWLIIIGLAFISLVALLLMLLRRFILAGGIERGLRNKKNMVQAVKAHLDDQYQYDAKEKIPLDADLVLTMEEKFKGIPLIDLTDELFDQVSRDSVDDLRALLLKARVDHHIAEVSVDRRAHKRIRAVEALRKIGGPIAEIMLLARLSDAEPEIRIEAAIGLTELDALPPLPGALEKMKIEQMGMMKKLYTLFRACAGTREAELLDVLKDTSQDFVKILCLHALGHVRSVKDTTIDVIQKSLDDQSADVIAEALRALTRLGVTTVYNQIIGLLSDDRWEVRAQAARSCGALEVIDSIPVLKLLKLDSNWWVRKRAIESLDLLKHLDTQVPPLAKDDHAPVENEKGDETNNVHYLRSRDG